MSIHPLKPQRDFEILAPGLNVLFVGINPPPGAVAAGGHSYASPSNRFWRVLFAAGFTDVLLRPQDERRLLDFKIGSTAVVLRPTRTAAEVALHEFRAARPDLEAKIHRFAPRVVAFLGKRAYSSMVRIPNAEWGLQGDPFAGRPAWILPNPSGLSRITMTELVPAYVKLRQALGTSQSD